MRASLLYFCAIVLLAGVGTAQADEWIPGYVAANGAYVPGHWQSDDAGNPANNYSNLQNVNPYTARPRPKPENYGAYVDPNDDGSSPGLDDSGDGGDGDAGGGDGD
jgi:hypothetical protein